MNELAWQQRILATALAHPDAAAHLAAASPPAEWFADPHMRSLYQAWRRVVEKGRVACPSLDSVIAEMGAPEDRHEAARTWLQRFVDQHADRPEVLTYYLERLRESYRARKLREAATLTLRGLEEGRDARELEAQLWDALLGSAAAAQAGPSSYPVGQGAGDVLAVMREQARAGSPGDVVPTGIEGLDRLLGGGVIMGTYSVWAGRPNMGKSAVLKSIAARVASRGTPCVLFSLEMPADVYIKRLLAEVAQVECMRLMNPQWLEEDEWERLERARQQVERWPLWIEDAPGLTVGQLYGRVSWYVRHKGVRAVFIDYLQLLKLNNGAAPETEAEWSMLASAVTEMTRELRVAGFYAAQLSRKVEERQDKRPQLSDIRNTGRIENDATYVIGLYREDYYNPQAPPVMELIVLKNRMGPTGTEEVYFDRVHQAIREHHVPLTEALRELDA